MTGWTAEEAHSRPLSEVFNAINQESREPVTNPISSCRSIGNVVNPANQTVLISRNGRESGIEKSARPIVSEHDEIMGTVIVFHDVTAQRRLSREINYRASHDPLTGLKNRAEFDLRLATAVGAAHTGANSGALLLIDLDRFKIVNDTCGHAVGDQLLAKIADLIRDAVRATDTVARLGGDEFAVLLAGDDIDAEAAAERVRAYIESRLSACGFGVTASVGAVEFVSCPETAYAALNFADRLMYRAKRSGKNQVACLTAA